MTGYVWRIPTVLGVTACSALMLFAAVVIALIVIRRRSSIITRVAVIATLALLAIGAGIAIRVTAWQVAHFLAIDVAYVDPGLLGYLTPLMFAAFAFVTGERVLNRSWTNWRALLYCAWVFAFTALNVVNYCSPGWCETIGFPLPWLTWSDSILTSGDGDLVQLVIDRAAPAVAVLLDLFAFVVIAHALARRELRESDRVLASETRPSSGRDWKERSRVPIWVIAVGALALSVVFVMTSIIRLADPLRLDILTVVSRVEPPTESGMLMIVCGPATGVARGMQLGLLGLLVGGIPAAVLAAALAARQRRGATVWSSGWGNVLLAGFVFQLCSVLLAAILLVLFFLAAIDSPSDTTEMSWWGTVMLLICVSGIIALPLWRRLEQACRDSPLTITPRDVDCPR